MLSMLPFLLLGSSVDPGQLVGRGQAAVEEGTCYPCGVIWVLAGFCSRALVHSSSGVVTAVVWLVLPLSSAVLATCLLSHLHCPQASAGQPVNSALSYTNTGVHRKFRGPWVVGTGHVMFLDIHILTSPSTPNCPVSALCGSVTTWTLS